MLPSCRLVIYATAKQEGRKHEMSCKFMRWDYRLGPWNYRLFLRVGVQVV